MKANIGCDRISYPNGISLHRGNGPPPLGFRLQPFVFHFAISRMYLLIVCVLLSDRFNVFAFEPKQHFTDVQFLQDVERRMCSAKLTTLANIHTVVRYCTDVIAADLKKDNMWLTTGDSLRETWIVLIVACWCGGSDVQRPTDWVHRNRLQLSCSSILPRQAVFQK